MSFKKEKHVKYWRMCSNMLPDHYISTDNSRTSLGFFIVSALDILGALDITSQTDRQGWIDWIYSCQIEKGGGFRGSPATKLGTATNKTNRHWDPASIPATFFALTALIILDDDLSRVDRDACLTWLPRMQRDDGSFGEVLSDDGKIEGGRDLRFCCCAAGIAYILQDNTTQSLINVDSLVGYIGSCRNYNGGFGESPYKEPHSGLTYCAISSLGLVKRLNWTSNTCREACDFLLQDTESMRWILERQTDVLQENTEEECSSESAEEERDSTTGAGTEMGQTQSQNLPLPLLPAKSKTESGVRAAGFNGRDGKIADTCYCFWNTGALAVLQGESYIDLDGMRRYLVNETQHTIGGFGKGPHDPPDVLHSYLGLATLALYREPGLKSIDPALCISQEAVERVKRLRWK